jgi:hypothetical protein
MCSEWQEFDEAESAARRGHAARLQAIASLLDDVPAACLAGEIASRAQVTLATARGWVREAEDLRSLPDLAGAYADGAVSQDQVTALRVLAEPGTDGAWLEALDAPDARREFGIANLVRMARRARAQALERSDRGRYLRMSTTPDERFVRGRFQLHPQEGAAVEAALDAFVPAGTRWSEFPKAHADALMRLVRDGGAGVRTTVVVRAHGDGSGELPDGTPLPAGVVDEMAALGRVIEVARPEVGQTKQIPQAVRRWVWLRDGARCSFPDCTAPPRELEIHHMVQRSRGGTHDPSGLALLCWRCRHVRVHREGWRLVGDAEVTTTWLTPDGEAYTPPPLLHRPRPPDQG